LQRQGPKGKKRQHSSDSDNGASDRERAPKHGRHKGSSNFSKEDVTKLLDLVETHLPLGQKGWKAVQSAFSKWASGLGHPERDVKSLETKYKMVCLHTCFISSLFQISDVLHSF
jgi:hypothetical protein